MEKPRFLYILAPSFSGSTLLTYLLAWHPRIATIGELKATQMGDIEQYRCSCGQLITECGFWKDVASSCRQRNVPFAVDDFDTVLHSPSPFANRIISVDVRGPFLEALRRLAIGVSPAAHRDLAKQIERNYELSRVVAETQNGDIFLDGSKDATRLLHFVRSGRWDVRVIYLQRDGRGVIASIAKHTGLPFDRAAEQWARNMRGLDNMRRRLPGSAVIDLKYEDLCRQPKQCLERIFGWLGIETIAVETKNFKDSRFHILGNSMRLSGMSDIRADESWRSKLDDAQKDYYLRRFGRIHKQLGYA
jgi:hypothetical protein